MNEVHEAIRDLKERGVRLSVDGETIRVSYRCPASELRKVKAAIAMLRARKQEAIVLLRAPADPHAMIEIMRCWHCGSPYETKIGECDCTACGVTAPMVVWKAGPCRTCLALKERMETTQ